MGAARAPAGPPAWMEAINDHADRIDRNVPISGGPNVSVTDSVTGNGRAIRFTGVTGKGGGGGASASDPWQPYPSPYQGTGTDPHASDRKMRFRITPSQVTGGATIATLSNFTQEFVAFGDPADNDIEQADAVWTQVYLKLTVEQSGVSTLRLNDGQIKLLESTSPDFPVSSLPEPPPDFGEDGTFPPYVIYPLRKIAYYGGTLHMAASDPAIGSGVSSYLNLSLVVTDAGCETQTRAFQWTST